MHFLLSARLKRLECKLEPTRQARGSRTALPQARGQSSALQVLSICFTMALLLQPCLHTELGRCPARQQYLSQRTGHAWPCARLAATRGSESPNEEVLERLKRAEAEAAQLRKEIAAARVRVGALSCWGAVGRLWRLAPVPLPVSNTQQKECVLQTRLRRPLSSALSKAACHPWEWVLLWLWSGFVLFPSFGQATLEGVIGRFSEPC